MELTSLSDAWISLIPIYGPWIIFGVVAFESAGVPLPGETILVGAASPDGVRFLRREDRASMLAVRLSLKASRTSGHLKSYSWAQSIHA